MRDVVRRATGTLAALSAFWGVWLVAFGGAAVTILGARVRSHDPLRPFLLFAVSLAIFLLTGGGTTIVVGLGVLRPRARAGWAWLVRAWHRDELHHAIVGAAALFVLVIGIAWGSTAAGGSDSFGYLSEAELWLQGRQSISQPWVKDVPWPDATWVFAPLGYTPSRPTRFTIAGFGPTQDPWAIVPTYSPGLPMLMALGKAMGGVCGPFMITPIGGALLVLCTYLIGLRLGSPTRGLIAALVLAASPPFLLMHFVNMTDVPVAGVFALACWCALGTTVRSAVGAAVALAVALLIRPNLLPVMPVFAVWLGWRVVSHQPERWRHVLRAVIVLAGVGVGSLATAAIYWFTYGTPFESGYGATGHYFALSHVVPNIRNYTEWFIEAHTVLGFVGLLALAVPVKALWRDVRERSALVAFAAMTVIMIAEFMIYLVLDNSSYLRFFLVCYPFLMLGLATVAVALAGVQRIAGPILATALVGSVVVKGLMILPQWGVFDQGLLEAKLADVAAHVRRATPDNSVVLTMNHSGSLRYYAGRVTLRWDYLDPNWLDKAVAWMAERGVHAYALLDDFEQPEAVKRFRGQKLVAVLEGPPVFHFGNKLFYDLAVPPGSTVETINLPVLDVGPTCWTPYPPPALVWKH
jgi:hypothetical protein